MIGGWPVARIRVINPAMMALDELARLATTHGLDFIVCGGHAVNAYQVIRKTGDIDLIVRERAVPQWRERLLALGYSVFHEDPAFLQLSPPTAQSWPVDLLVVDDTTFDAMKRAARPFVFGAVTCLIPSVEHLICMKLHALRFSGEQRIRKDAIDIIELAEANDLDLLGEAFRALCDRFADVRVYERILQYAGKR